METNLLVPSVAVEALSLDVYRDSNSIRIVKLTKPVWLSSTAVGEIGLADKSISIFSNISNSNYTIISQGLTPQDEMHTYMNRTLIVLVIQ